MKREKKLLQDKIRNYNKIGRKLYKLSDLKEVSKELSEAIQSAESFFFKEENHDWFDTLTIKRNIKELNAHMKSFKKFAEEAHVLHQRLTALYEDIGNILNRYFEIDDDADADMDEKFSDGEEKKKKNKPSKKKKIEKIIQESFNGMSENQALISAKNRENRLLTKIVKTDRILKSA